jgi:hypothetical protein
MTDQDKFSFEKEPYEAETEEEAPPPGMTMASNAVADTRPGRGAPEPVPEVPELVLEPDVGMVPESMPDVPQRVDATQKAPTKLELPPPAPHPAEEAEVVPERVTGVAIPREDSVDAAIRQAATSANGQAKISKAVYLEVGGFRYRCVPKPPGHATATISRLTGTVAAASLNKTPAQVKDRASKDSEFLLTISTAPGELADIAIGLITPEHRPHFVDRWTGAEGVPVEEYVTEPDLIPALMDLMAQYTRQTVPLPSPSTDT